MARDGLLVALSLVGLYVGVLAWAAAGASPGGDAHIYWSVSLGDPYHGAIVGGDGAYLYSPAFLQALSPLRLMPWPIFHGVWEAGLLAALVYLMGRWSLAALVFVPVVFELHVANVNLLLALAIVAGFRYPAAWSFVLLTKVTPGIGLLWFAARREWRNLGIALGATAAIAGISFVLAPGLWADWLGVLTRSGGAAPEVPIPIGPLWVRLVAAGCLVVYAARTDRRVLLAAAIAIAMPVLWFATPATLVAARRLADRGTSRSTVAQARSAPASIRPVTPTLAPTP